MIPTQRTPGRTEAWALVDRIQAGDREAFGDLYRQYREPVLRYARSRAPQHADDIAAEVFARGLVRIGTITWQGLDVGAWLMTVTRNLIADHYKSAHTRLADPYGADHDLVDHPADDDPHADAERRELRRDVETALGLLIRDHADVLRWRYLDGLSTRQVAQRLGVNESAVKARLNRAVGALRRTGALQAHR
jgi:RNA polymerase sigma-70 factor, ECF subfamily